VEQDTGPSQSGKMRLRSGRVEVAGLSICRGLDYGTGCSWWGTALTPAHLSPTTQSERERERERERRRGRELGKWLQVKETPNVH
jgi:hypothetical protein